jgi:hypothetical protein
VAGEHGEDLQESLYVVNIAVDRDDWLGKIRKSVKIGGM